MGVGLAISKERWSGSEGDGGKRARATASGANQPLENAGSS